MSGRGRTALALAAVAAGVFISALDQTMVVTVLPSIMKTLHISALNLDQAAWVITGYLLGYTVAMPLFGRFADVWGRRAVWTAAVALFMVGSLGCVLAGSLTTLVAARVFQAAGGGAMVPVAMAVSADLVPLERRAFALGIIGAAAEAGGVLGPLYGATLAQQWGWHTIFLINIPLGALLILACLVFVPRSAPRPAGAGARTIDYVGAAFMAAALACLTIGLSGSTQAGSSGLRPPWLVASAASFGVFFFWELRQADPLIRLSLFRNRSFAAANATNFAVGVALIVGMVEIPLYAYSLLGKSEVSGGLLLMRLTVMIPVGAVIGGWIADRIGSRITAMAGFLLTGVGYLLIANWPSIPSAAQMTLDLAVTGIGFGLVIAPISATVIETAGKKWMATGSALVTVMRMVGMMVGLSALSSYGLRTYKSLLAGHTLPLRTAGMSDAEYDGLRKAYNAVSTAALHTVYNRFFLVAAGVSLLAVIPAVLLLKRRAGGRRLPFLPQ